MARFIDRCTASVDILTAGAYVRGESVFSLARAISETQSVTGGFGEPTTRQIALGTGGGPGLYQAAWSLDWTQLDTAVSLVAEHETPKAVMGLPALLAGFEAVFKLRDPSTGEILPWQGHEYYPQQDYLLGHAPFGLSYISAQISRESTCAITLMLPFEDVTDEVRRIASDLDAHLPFRLSPKQWSRWQLNKAETSYYARKVTVL
jgi:hypothetical protein